MAAIRALPPEQPDECGCECSTWGHEDCQGREKGLVPVRLETAAYGVVEIAICKPCSGAIAERIARRS